MLRAGEGKEARLGRWGGFQPMANRKMKKIFYFSNLFKIPNQFEFK
jgi:hypothetical protein